jgi:hypothetical protein
MRVLFLVTAHNSLSQRLALALQARGHAVTVELALSPVLMIEAADLAKPDVILCPFLTKRVPAEIYANHLTLIVHPVSGCAAACSMHCTDSILQGAPGDAGPSAIDMALFGDQGEHEDWETQLQLINERHSAPGASASRRSHWAITVLQAIEALDAGPIGE